MNKKLRNLRDDKRISQQIMAKILNISQTQYFRKESNQFAFSSEEWKIMASFLETEVENIKDENAKEIPPYNNDTVIRYDTVISYAINQSEKMVAEFQEENQLLKEIIETQKEEIQILKSKIIK